jgi:HSP20 family protein
VADRKFEERWENFRDLVEHLFLEPSRGSLEGDVIWYPATDAYETQDEFVIRLDLSGVARKKIKIMMRGRIVDIEGVRGDVTSEGRKTFHKMEIAKGPFARCIQVPERFIGAKASAAYDGGVLEVRLAARPRSGPKKITIVVG